MSEDLETEDGMTELEKEFDAHRCAHMTQIRAKLIEAKEALQEAIDLADKHGIPFTTSISFLPNAYVPRSFGKSKFAKIDSERLSELTDIYSEWQSDLFSRGGWKHSDVC